MSNACWKIHDLFYETLNLSSWDLKLSTSIGLPQMATLGVGAFQNFHYFPISLQFISDFYETLNLSSQGLKLSTPVAYLKWLL